MGTTTAHNILRTLADGRAHPAGATKAPWKAATHAPEPMQTSGSMLGLRLTATTSPSAAEISLPKSRVASDRM